MTEYKTALDDCKLKLNICQLERDNLAKKLEANMEDKNSLINCYYVMIKAVSEYNEALSQMLRECVNVIETKAKLFYEKEMIMEQLLKNKIKDLNRNNLYQTNPEINKMIAQEQITLQNLINEFESKINEKDNQLISIKDKINQYLLDIKNKPLIDNYYNGRNNYNYQYQLNNNENGIDYDISNKKMGYKSDEIYTYNSSSQTEQIDKYGKNDINSQNNTYN